MNEYQSFGVGVNSVALGLLLDCEKVFSDTGAEYPETYEYIKYYQSLKGKITILKPNVQGHETRDLEDYIPHQWYSRKMRGGNVNFAWFFRDSTDKRF